MLLLAEGQLGQALPVLLGADAAERLVAAGLTAQELKFLFSVVGEDAGFPSLPDFSQPAQPSSSPDVEAAVMAGYGVDVLDPAVTPRRVAVLVERLPPFARGPGEEWSTEADLLALLIDHVANLTWITLRAHGSKAGRGRGPASAPPDNPGRYGVRQ